MGSPVTSWPYLDFCQGRRATDACHRSILTFGKASQNPSHLFADRLDQQKFLVGIPLVVGQPGSERLLVTAEQGWFVLGNHSLYPVRTDDLEVCQMADDLQRGPLAGNGPGEELLAAHPGSSLS